MRHYELVFLVHPEQSEQVPAMIEKYRALIKKGNGKVYRVEDWGKRPLAYNINRVHKAHYVLMNIEGDAETTEQLRGVFEYNDAVLRHMIMRVSQAETQPSVMMEKVRQERKREVDRSKASEDKAPEDKAGGEKTEERLASSAADEVKTSSDSKVESKQEKEPTS
jgi:small subunit ribosomal protein S6